MSYIPRSTLASIQVPPTYEEHLRELISKYEADKSSILEEIKKDIDTLLAKAL